LTPRADAAWGKGRDRAIAGAYDKRTLEKYGENAAPNANNSQVSAPVRQSATEEQALPREAGRRADEGKFQRASERALDAQGKRAKRSPQRVHDGAKTAKKRKWRAAPEGNCWLKAVEEHQPLWRHAPLGRQRCAKVRLSEPTCSRAFSHMRSARACQRIK
jgi:hypothetical protein